MKRVFIDILNHMDRIPNLDELLPKEFAQATQWKEEGLLSHLFIKEDKTGAILVMNGVEIDKAKELVATLPMHNFFEKVDYSYIDEQF